MQTITNGWEELCTSASALWFHDGNPKRPHAELTGGKHSNGFFNGRIITGNEPLLEQAAADLVELFFRRYGEIGIAKIGRVAGPETGATRLADALAKHFSARRGFPCPSAHAKKGFDSAGAKIMRFDANDSPLAGDIVLLCEDTITSGESFELAARPCTEANAIVLPDVLALMNRSAAVRVRGKEIISLMHRPMATWAPEECPLCKQGSVALRPKQDHNWQRLITAY